MFSSSETGHRPANFVQSGAIRVQAVGDNRLRSTVTLEGILDEFQGRGLVPLLGDKGFQHFPLVVDRTPQVLYLAFNAVVHLVKMPLSWVYWRM